MTREGRKRRLAAFIVLCVLSVGVAGYAVVAYGFLPLGSLVHPKMRDVFEVRQVGIYCHVFASVLALAIGPFQFWTRLRTSRPALHRWMGRMYLGVGVLVGGVSGLYMASSAYGGLVSQLGFGLLAVVWLWTGFRAYLSIRGGDVTAHQIWMIRNFSLTFGAVTLRIYLPLSMVSGIGFSVAYPIIAWLAWVPNLIAAEWFIRKMHRPALKSQGQDRLSASASPSL